jgi:hypothetical protein
MIRVLSVMGLYLSHALPVDLFRPYARSPKGHEEIESILDSYAPGELAPDKIIGEIFKERAKQRPILEKAVQ